MKYTFGVRNSFSTVKSIVIVYDYEYEDEWNVRIYLWLRFVC